MNPQNANSQNPSTDTSASPDNLVTAYPYPVDAIVLAGTHQNPSRLIDGRNKAFLDVNGQILVRYVIDALLQAAQINRVFVVGPAQKLVQAMPQLPPRVYIIDQRGKMLSNCWAGIEASESFHGDDPQVPAAERPILITSCDIPLATAAGIDDFVARCAEVDRLSGVNNGILVGVVDEPGVLPFYPEPDKPGVKRPYVELAGGRLRLANIYVARPRKLSEHEYLQTGFSHRKAKNWRNVLVLAFNFLRSPQGWQATWMTARLQLTLMLSKNKGRLYRYLKKGNKEKRVEELLSKVLGGELKIVVTPFGGLSLDVDDEEDYRVLASRFDDWAAITAATQGRGSKSLTAELD